MEDEKPLHREEYEIICIDKNPIALFKTTEDNSYGGL